MFTEYLRSGSCCSRSSYSPRLPRPLATNRQKKYSQTIGWQGAAAILLRIISEKYIQQRDPRHKHTAEQTSSHCQYTTHSDLQYSFLWLIAAPGVKSPKHRLEHKALAYSDRKALMCCSCLGRTRFHRIAFLYITLISHKAEQQSAPVWAYTWLVWER